MLDGIPITGELSAEYLVGLAVLMVFIGWLVPKRTLTKEERNSERWQQAYENERQARLESDRQVGQLLELAKTTKAIIEAMFATTGGTRVPKEE